VHRIGGHTLGLQAVRVKTARGHVVLASDASHYYANMAERRPFPIVHDVGAMVSGWARCRSLAEGDEHVIPGHDPLVMLRYPPPLPELSGVAVRLDVRPLDPEAALTPASTVAPDLR
jgi:glyoxylase-like metal-dependent hydrolase (beta-lactamase superfamily II)